jgi:hypothetical protein
MDINPNHILQGLLALLVLLVATLGWLSRTRPRIAARTLTNQSFLRGLFLLAIALLFGVGALRYKVGSLAHAGPGLFPLGVSLIVGFLGVVTLVRSMLIPPVPMSTRVLNIVLILAALIGFALISEYLDMTVGILFMVFFASLGTRPYSWKRNLVIAVVLLAIAYAFQQLLGLNLPLF